MSVLFDILIITTFLLEVSILLYLEYKNWNTILTPLCFLMLPYTGVLLVTMICSKAFGFVDLYYPSIIIWNIGLLVFAIPSYLVGYVVHKSGKQVNSIIKTPELPNVVLIVGVIISLLFAVRFYAFSGSTIDLFGSEEFGMAFCGTGLWGHLRQLGLPIIMISLYYLDRNHLLLLPIIILLVVVLFVYQVKGWVLVPCLAGLFLRAYSGKTQIRLSLLLWLFLGAFVLFLIMYWLLPVLAGGSASIKIVGFIFKHFFHYLSSGVLGLSEDMLRGFPDKGNFEVIVSPLVNMANTFFGNGEIISPVNPFFYHTGVNLTNVRTFFGTLYIYSGPVVFVIYTLLLSLCLYLLKLATIKFGNIYIYCIYFFECSLLCMGWFEFYFFHLTAFEIPAILLLFMAITYCVSNDKDMACCEESVL